VLALGYTATDAAVIEGPLDALQVAIGVPQGSGSVHIPAGAYGITSAGAEAIFTVATNVMAGTTADVLNLTSSNVSVTTTSIGAGMLNMTIEVGFEEAGAEIAGTFVSYVPCWTCEGYQVPRSRCSTLTIDCVLAAIGASFNAIGEPQVRLPSRVHPEHPVLARSVSCRYRIAVRSGGRAARTAPAELHPRSGQ
jgi:hypothetical protein